MNNIEDLKNHIDIPEEIDFAIDKGIKRGKEEKIKSKRSFKYKKVIVAATVTIGFLGFASLNPAFAESLPGIGDLVKYLNNSYSYNSNIEKYSDDINIVQDKNNMNITLEGVTYDESSLKFIYTITSKEKLQWGVQMRNTSLKINGKEARVKTGNGVTREHIDDVKIENQSHGKEKYAVVNSYDVSDLDLDKDISIEWTINEIHLQDGKYNKGPWNFSFKTSKDKLAKNTKTLNINHVYDIDGYKFTLNKIVVTPIEIKVISTQDKKLREDLGEVISKAEKAKKTKERNESVPDELDWLMKNLEDTKENNELVQKYYKLKEIDEKMRCFELGVVTNENNEDLAWVSGKGHNGGYMHIYKPLKEMPQKIIYTPKNYSYKTNKTKTFKDEYFETTLDALKVGNEFKQGENMSIAINSISKDKKNLDLELNYKGEFKNSRVSSESILLVPQNISLDERIDGYNKKKELVIKSGIMGNSIKEFLESQDNIKRSFELDTSKDYKVWIKKINPQWLDKENQLIIDVK